MPPFRKIAPPLIGLAGILASWHPAPAQPSPPLLVGEEVRRAQADFANGGARRLAINWSTCIDRVRASQDANAAERCVVYGYGALLADDTAETENNGPRTRHLTAEIVAPVQLERLDIMGIPPNGQKLWLDRYRRWVFQGLAEEPGIRTTVDTGRQGGPQGGPGGDQTDLANLAAGQTPLEALRQPAIADALRGVLGRQLFARLKDYSFGSPMESNGHVTIGLTCMPHNCGVAEARYVFSANDVWVGIVDGKRMRVYGGPPPRAQELLMRYRNQVVWRGAVEDMSRPIVTAVVTNSRSLESEPPPPPVQPANDISEIRLRKHGGTFMVPVVLNNTMTLPFMIDSGATDVSVSPGVVEKLLQSGTLLRADFLGKQTYSLADGSKVSNDTFRLRVLKMGDREIRDVLCSVPSEEGGFLLGQSFLTRFRSWSIDNQRHMLVLK